MPRGRRTLSREEYSDKCYCCRKLRTDIDLYLKEKGMRQFELEDELGMKPGKISDLYEGKCSRGTIEAFCKVIGKEREEYFDDKTWSLIQNTSSKVFKKNDEVNQEQTTIEEISVDLEEEPTKNEQTIMTAFINISVQLIDLASAIKEMNEKLVNVIDEMGEELFRAYNEVYGLEEKKND